MITTKIRAGIKKGSRVYLFSNWDRKGGCLFEEFTVESIGQVRAHVRETSGAMHKREIWSGRYADLALVSDVADVRAEAVRRGALFRDEQIAHLNRCLAHNGVYRPSAAYLKSIQRDLDAILAATPRAISADEGLAEVRANMLRKAG